MEKSRKTTILVIVALVIAVISLGVAFAAFSTTLNINGNATVQNSSWKVHLATTSSGADPGSTATTLPSGSISTTGTAQSSSTALTTDTFTWTGTFKTPGDKITYTFYVRNTGSYAATLGVSGATLSSGSYNGTVTCKQGSTATTESATVCSHLKYKITLGSTSLASTGYTTVTVEILLDNTGWSTDGSDLPTSPVTVTANQIQITATQS